MRTEATGTDGVNFNTQLSNNFVLVNDINASGTANWNAGAGFARSAIQDGFYNRSFTGTFDGQNHTIRRAHDQSSGDR